MSYLDVEVRVLFGALEQKPPHKRGFRRFGPGTDGAHVAGGITSIPHPDPARRREHVKAAGEADPRTNNPLNRC